MKRKLKSNTSKTLAYNGDNQFKYLSWNKVNEEVNPKDVIRVNNPEVKQDNKENRGKDNIIRVINNEPPVILRPKTQSTTKKLVIKENVIRGEFFNDQPQYPQHVLPQHGNIINLRSLVNSQEPVRVMHPKTGIRGRTFTGKGM